MIPIDLPLGGPTIPGIVEEQKVTLVVRNQDTVGTCSYDDVFRISRSLHAEITCRGHIVSGAY